MRLAVASDTSSVSSAGDTPEPLRKGRGFAGGALSQEISPRKLLISISNMEYVISHLLTAIVRRLGESGVKFGDLIHKKCKQKFVHYRQNLIRHYVALKLATITSLLESVDYSQVPEEEDASEFTKELIMCAVFIQAELHLLAPHLVQQVLSAVVESSVQELVKIIPKRVPDLKDSQCATQVAIDITTLEEAFKCFMSSNTKNSLNSIRVQSRGSVDRESFQASMQSVTSGLKMAIDSLQVSAADKEDADESRDTVEDV